MTTTQPKANPTCGNCGHPQSAHQGGHCPGSCRCSDCERRGELETFTEGS